MDACDAEYNAFSYKNDDIGEKCFPDSCFLMCWFHVEYNVGKKIIAKHVPTVYIPQIKADIKMLHGTLSKEEYLFQLNVVNARWQSFQGVKEFQDYFWSEWVDGRFKNWQIWNTPCAGVATTNSCIESFNKQIKFVYTGYELYTVCKFLDICFDKLINQFSCQPKEFCFYRPPTFDMIVKANRILEIEPNPFTSGGINVYYITSKSKAGYQYQLSVQDHQAYPGFKFVWCNCIGIVKT